MDKKASRPRFASAPPDRPDWASRSTYRPVCVSMFWHIRTTAFAIPIASGEPLRRSAAKATAEAMSSSGSTTVRTVTRPKFVEDCPNLGRLLKQLTFDVDTENRIMGAILDDGEEALPAAKAEIKAHPERLDAWLAGVTTLDGQDGAAAVKAALGL